MAVGIIRTGWSGTTGGAGLTQWAIAETLEGGVGSFFTTTNVQTAVNAMRTFWDAVKAYVPNEVTLTVSPTVDIYDEVSGDLIASITAPTPPTNVVGTDSGAFAMASGMKLALATGTIRNGRRVRGSTYIVPSGASTLTTSGLVASAARTATNTAGAAFATALATPLLIHVVYSRPLPAEHPLGPRDGALALITAYDTNEKTAVLRGRRD
jgi:hypothetical protein